MKPFSEVVLSEPNKIQKLFKTVPAENALEELNNLLASRAYEEISIADIEEIDKKYKLDVLSKFKNQITKLFEDFVKYHLGLDIPNEGLRFAPKLANILQIDEKKVDLIFTDVVSEIFRKRYEMAIAKRRLSDEDEKILDKLWVDLGLTEEKANEISKEVRIRTTQKYVDEVTKDGEISPEEYDELQETAKCLSVKMMFDDKTKKKFENMRLMWKINHSELPAIEPGINLPKKETCFYMQPVDWYEYRAVRSSVTYGGLSGRIKIAKGIYYRVGKMNLIPSSTQERVKIDSGIVYITNKRVIFSGLKKNTTIQISSILEVHPYSDGVEIIKDSGKSPFLGFTDTIEVFTAILARVISDNL